MGQTIRRRRGVREAGFDERRFWLFFTTGKVVDPSRCPKGFHAHGHWHRLEVDPPDGEPNCECECVRQAREESAP